MDIASIIVAATPAITAVIGIIVSLVVGIKKIKKTNLETKYSVDSMSKHSKDLELELAKISKENAELKRTLMKVMSKLEHVHFVDKE